jgi:hypothetical protein
MLRQSAEQDLGLSSGSPKSPEQLPFLTDAELGSPQVLDPVTITHVLPKKYPTGTAE